MTISIVLADDHPIVRQGLKALLEVEADFRLLGEAGNGLDAIELVEQLHPQVLVVDLMMPGLGGADVALEVSKRSPETHVLVLSMHDDDAYVRQSLRSGAIGYALKDGSASELVHAIREVAAGRRYLSPAIMDKTLYNYVGQVSTEAIDSYDTLTIREREVLHLVMDGCTSAQIGIRLFISPRTAETHRANIMRKLGLKSQAELIRFAFERGISPR